MRAVNPMKAGLAAGVMLGVWHLAWATLVAIGFAQPLADFILRIHFFPPFLRVQAFDLTIALELVSLTAVIGFLIGSIAALIWNGLNGHAQRRAPGREAEVLEEATNLWRGG